MGIIYTILETILILGFIAGCVIIGYQLRISYENKVLKMMQDEQMSEEKRIADIKKRVKEFKITSY